MASRMAEESLPQTPPLYALLVGLAAFAGWTTSRCIVPRGMGWVRELIRPTPSSATLSWHTKVAQRGSLVDLSINAFAAAGDLIRALRTGRSVVMDQPLDRLTHFQAPISIHSPPIAS